MPNENPRRGGTGGFRGEEGQREETCQSPDPELRVAMVHVEGDDGHASGVEPENLSENPSRATVVGSGSQVVVVANGPLLAATLSDNLADTLGIGLVLRGDVHRTIVTPGPVEKQAPIVMV